MVNIIMLQDTEISQNFYIYPITALVDRQENIYCYGQNWPEKQ